MCDVSDQKKVAKCLPTHMPLYKAFLAGQLHLKEPYIFWHDDSCGQLWLPSHSFISKEIRIIINKSKLS